MPVGSQAVPPPTVAPSGQEEWWKGLKDREGPLESQVLYPQRPLKREVAGERQGGFPSSWVNLGLFHMGLSPRRAGSGAPHLASTDC